MSVARYDRAVEEIQIQFVDEARIDDNYSRARTENDFGPAVFHRCRHLCGLESGLGCGVCDAVALIGDASV